MPELYWERKIHVFYTLPFILKILQSNWVPDKQCKYIKPECSVLKLCSLLSLFFFNIWIINRVTWYGWWKKCVIKCSTKSKKAFAWTAGREKEKSCWVTSSCSIHIWFRHSQFCFVHWWMVLKQEAIEESVGHKWHICIICIAW